MTTTMESDLPVGAGNDQSQASQPGGVQQSSPGGVGLETVLQRLDSLDAQIRGLQSATDKNKAATSREVNQLKEQITRAKSYLDKYPDPDEAARQMAIDDFIGGTQQAQFLPVSANPPQVSGGQPTTPGTFDPELLALLGISESDPHFVAEMASGKSAMDAAKAVARAKQQAAPPSPAGIMPTGGSAPATTQKAALQAAYDKEIAQVRRGDWSGIEAIKAKYRGKGLTDLW